MNNTMTIINPQKPLKTFVFEREDTQQSIIVEHQVDLNSSSINLSYLFSLYCPLAQNKVSIYDSSIFRFVTLSKIGSQNGHIPQHFLEPTFILIRYIGKSQYTGESDSVDSSIQNQSRFQKKDNRSKERTIGEAIQFVKKWRDLHIYGHKALKKRLNLQDAAKMIGISKKSLDDYYCQLRLGELYNFNFYDNMNEKIGFLRTYVKNYRPERELKRRQNAKHPKTLRIISQFDLQTKKLKQTDFQIQQRGQQNSLNPALRSPVSEQNENQMLEQNRQGQQARSEQSPIAKELFSLENEFFKCFDLALDNEGDLYYDVERDFRKKDFALDSDSFLLFE